MADHKHGQMDTTEQQRTFAGFLRWAGITVIVVALILILLTTRI